MKYRFLSPIFLIAFLPLVIGCDNNDDNEVDELPGGVEERPDVDGPTNEDGDENYDDEENDGDDESASSGEMPLLTEIPTPEKEWQLQGRYTDLTFGGADLGVLWLVTTDPEMLYAFNASDGTIVWQQKLEHVPTDISYSPADNLLYLVSADSFLRVIHPDDGREVRSVFLPFSGGDIVMSQKGFGVYRFGDGRWNIFDPNQNDSLYAVRPYSGNLLRNKPSQDYWGNLWGVTDHDQLLCVQDGQNIYLESDVYVDGYTSMVWSSLENVALVSARGEQHLFEPDKGDVTLFSSYDYYILPGTATIPPAAAFDPTQPVGSYCLWMANVIQNNDPERRFFVIRDQNHVVLEAESSFLYEGLVPLPDKRHILGWGNNERKTSVCFQLFDAKLK